METTILNEINPISDAFSKLANNLSDRKTLDYLLENFNEDELKTELVKFSKDFLISTLDNEIELQKRYKRKLGTFDELVKYLLKNICSKDPLRPAMNAVYYDMEQSNLVSTDAHILVAMSLKNLPISDINENITCFAGDVFLSKYSFEIVINPFLFISLIISVLLLLLSLFFNKYIDKGISALIISFDLESSHNFIHIICFSNIILCNE